MSENTLLTENKMGTMPVPRLLLSMSLPMIVSMLVQAFYNIVDSIFVARIDEAALTAVTMSYPVQNLMLAICTGTGVGVNALLSRSLGERKPEDARLAATNGLFLSVLGTIAFALFGFFGARSFFASQTDNQMIIEYGVQYLQICTIFSFGLFLEISLERILQSTGRTIFNMFSQGIGAITNIILDPIMIFGLFGFPALGIRGAAIATVLGQILAMFLSLFFNMKFNTDISIRMRGFRPHIQSIKTIYSVGIPSIIMISLSSVMTYGLNLILGALDTIAITILGVYFKLQSFIFMPVFGLNNGMVPIIAYNYGARNKERIMGTIKMSIGISIGIMLVGLVIFQTFPVQLLQLFNASDIMLKEGVPALKQISIGFVFAGYCIIVSSVFQALGNGVYSLFVSIARQMLCILPVAYFLAHTYGLHTAWFAFPLAEIVSLTLCSILFKRIYDQKIKLLN